MRIDFGFFDGRDSLCVAGWSDRGELEPALIADGRRVPALHVMRFRRRDLRTDEPLGLLVVFPRRTVPDEADELVIEPAPGIEPVRLPRSATERGEETLIASGVDEVFTAWLKAVALRRISHPGREVSAAALERVQSAIRAMPAETPSLAVNLERLVIAPSGIGVGTGWCLTDSTAEQPLLALIWGGRSLRPVHLAAHSLPRPDLAGYRDRYRYTGSDGFFCAFRMPVSPDPEARLIVLGNVGNAPLVFGCAAEAVTDLTAAEMVGALRGILAGAEQDARLLGALVPRAAPAMAADLDAAAARDAEALGGEAEPECMLLLSADVGAVELRDALRAVAGAIPGTLDVLPLGNVDAAGRTALAAGANEAGPRVSIFRTLDTSDLADLAPAAGTRVLFGRASALLQLGIPDPVAGRAVVVAHDPVGRLHDSEDGPATWQELRSAPAVATLHGALLAEALRVAPRGLLTPDGVIDAVLRTLEAAGRLAVVRSPVVTFYPGMSGTAAQALAGTAHSPATLDAEMLDLAAEDLT